MTTAPVHAVRSTGLLAEKEMQKMEYLLCDKCKKSGFKRPSACCPGDFPKAGDHVAFLSDKQTEKGPSSGVITISCGKQILINHSDCSEEFSVDSLVINKKTRHHKGGVLWMFD